MSCNGWNRSIRCLPLAALLCAITGCNDNSPALNPLGNGDMPPPASSGDMATGATMSAFFTVTDVVTKAPISGVQVCVYPAMSPCAVTANQGTAPLQGVPANSEVLFSLVAMTYQSELLTYTTATKDLQIHQGLVQEALVQATAGALNVQLDATRGLLHLLTQGVANVKFGLQPGPSMATQGPYYGNSMGRIDNTTMQTTGPNFDGLYVNLPPADYEALYFPPTACTTIDASWTGAGANQAKARVVAGFLTEVVLDCNH
jgi:hypothetical protein